MKLGLSKVSIILIVFASILSLGAGYQIGHANLPAASCNLALGTGSMKCIEFQMQDILFPDAVACPTYSATQSGLCQSTGGVLTLNSGGKATTVDASGNLNLNNALSFPAIADSATAGKLFLSSTTANTLKYYDASSGLHSIAALDLAQTFTGAVTMNALTLGGGMTATGQTITGGTFSAPTLSGTVAGTYTLGGTPSLGVALNGGGQIIYSVGIDLGTNPSDVGNTQIAGPRTGGLQLIAASSGSVAQVMQFYTQSSTAAGTGNSVLRLQLGAGAAQGSAGITMYEPLTLTGTQIGTYTLGGTPTVGSSLAVSGTTLNLGSASAYFANIFGNLLTFEGASAGLAGTYNIGGTPTFTAAPALSSGITLPSGGLMMFSNAAIAASMSGGANYYCPPIGFVVPATGVGNGCSTTEADSKMAVPVKSVAQNFYASVTVAPGVGDTWTVTLRDNGANTAITCTISGAAATSCTDTSHTVAIAAGDKLDTLFTANAAASTEAADSYQLVPSG